MIWLVKTHEKAITDGVKNTYKYLKDCMEPADQYIRKIKPNKITSKIRANANYHLYQLMELYVDCKVVSKWLTLKTDDEKIDFFQHFTDLDYLKSICDFSNSYCSQFEYNSFSEPMKNTIIALFNENIADFKNAFQKCVENFKIQQYENGLTEIDAIASMLSFYLNQGSWTALRIIPTTYCRYDTIKFHGTTQFNYDFISAPIMAFNNKFELEPVFDNFKFYEDSARDCFLFFLELAEKVYDSEIEIRLEKLVTDVEILKRSDLEKSNTLTELTKLIDEYIYKKNQNNKLVYYQTLSQEDLIKCFYDVYQVPHDFLDIIQTYPFEEKIILSKDFKITEGYQALIISYLDRFVNSKKDIALLRVLFHIESKNPTTAKKGYVDRLQNFIDFIKIHTKN